jgi:hypothetical protein
MDCERSNNNAWSAASATSSEVNSLTPSLRNLASVNIVPKTHLALTSLTAAVPAGLLAFLIVSTFLSDSFDRLF